MITIPVNLSEVKSSRRYDILLGSGLLGQIGERVKGLYKRVRTVAVITDDNVSALYLEPVAKSLGAADLRVVSYSIPPGEASKCAESYFAILSWLAGEKLTRADLIVALGGGVVGDLAGFAAATYLRGIPFVQVPTTLLAMVDSSVGGKTAIDLPESKNLVGAFYQPSLVICDPDVLKTLSSDVFHDGCAEMIKHGMIADGELLDRLGDFHELSEIIGINIKIKRSIVQEDEFDTGQRQLLNFGHTVGHSIEALSGYEITHGKAVAIGMRIMTKAAVRKGLCPEKCLDVLDSLLSSFSLPREMEYPPEALYEAALGDKKRTGDFLTEVIPRGYGKCVLEKMPVTELLDWIKIGVAL